jgi:glycerol-3-phosphate dehydrogenase (NAD(P)+)
MPKIAIIGTTSWGITLGVVLANKGLEVKLWARNKQEATAVRRNGPNPNLLPGVKFPPSLSVTDSLKEALANAKAVILVVPSQSMRQNIKLVAPYLDESMLIISAAKGLEIGTGQRMSQVVMDEIDAKFRANVCVLSGPNLSQEILQDLPAATVLAAADEAIARKAQKLLSSPRLCVFTNTDVIGVELGGALKNIVALGAGLTDGLSYGDNAKAALITRGLTEITALGVALGASPLTFSGLAGLGDLITTCASPLSRNHYVGVELAKGRSLKEITESMDGVAEGVSTTLAVRNLAHKMGLEMPITETIYRILYEGADIRQAATGLMNAGAAHELAGRKWRLFSSLRRRQRSKSMQPT